MAQNTGTIDVTDLVENMRETFVDWGVRFLVEAAMSVSWLSWLGLPVILPLYKFLLTQLLTALSKGIEMQAFFMNTAIKKASQAQDFIDAVAAKNNLPPTASFEDYENAEKKQMAAFRNLVLVTD